MRQRTNLILGLTAVLAVVMAVVSSSQPLGRWQIFILYLLLGLISACFKVALPGGQSRFPSTCPTSCCRSYGCHYPRRSSSQ